MQYIVFIGYSWQLTKVMTWLVFVIVLNGNLDDHYLATDFKVSAVLYSQECNASKGYMVYCVIHLM